jgi:hypothetical protein
MQNKLPPAAEKKASACCASLRCKSMYYRSDERPGRLHDEESMGYWCAETSDPVGPDRGLASHARCQPGRSCHKT